MPDKERVKNKLREVSMTDWLLETEWEKIYTQLKHISELESRKQKFINALLEEVKKDIQKGDNKK